MSYECLCEAKGYITDDCHLHGKKKHCEICGEADHEGQTCPVMIRKVEELRKKMVDSCPSCASLSAEIGRLRGKMGDIEGMAKVMCYTICERHSLPHTVDEYWGICPKTIQDVWIERARALAAYLLKKEG